MTHKPPFAGDDSIPEVREFSSFNGENKEVNDDSDVQSELEEVNTKLDPYYDPNYPPLTKWTGDHPKTHVIGETSAGVLTRSQIKAK